MRLKNNLLKKRRKIMTKNTFDAIKNKLVLVPMSEPVPGYVLVRASSDLYFAVGIPIAPGEKGYELVNEQMTKEWSVKPQTIINAAKRSMQKNAFPVLQKHGNNNDGLYELTAMSVVWTLVSPDTLGAVLRKAGIADAEAVAIYPITKDRMLIDVIPDKEVDNWQQKLTLSELEDVARGGRPASKSIFAYVPEPATVFSLCADDSDNIVIDEILTEKEVVFQ